MTLNKKREADVSLYSLVFMILLAVDAIIVRPVAVYAQRILSDAYPPQPLSRKMNFDSLNLLQKVCRFFFFLEAVIAGFVGSAYFVFPEMFFYLYGYPVADSEPITLWCLSQFGVLMLAFGMYQMSVEIDEKRSMMAWWMSMNGLWLYVFWEGTWSRLGPWNPFALTGATAWCHAAFHIVMILAVLRWISLACSYFGKGIPDVMVDAVDAASHKKSSSSNAKKKD